MAENRETGPTPPYVSYRTFKTFLRLIAQALPSRIDKHVMPTFSGANQTMIIHTLKYFGLIDDVGVPTQRLSTLLNALDDEEAYQKAMFDLFDDGYPFLDSPSFDLANATDGQLNEEFGKLAQGDTIRKCKGFFLAALKDVDANISPYIKEPGKRGPAKGSKRRGRPAKSKKEPNNRDAPEKPVSVPQPSQSLGVHPALIGMLRELPREGEPWSKKRKDTFTAAVRGILDVIYPDNDG